jgi:hypothetical protein
MIRRSGATLIEVLTAIFVMGIGLLALLALFPLGALSMAQAIKDSRTAHAAHNALALLEARTLHRDGSVTGRYSNPALGDATEKAAPPDGPSWPVYVDPIGTRSYRPTWNARVGNVSNGNGPIPRVSPSFTGALNPRILNYFSLLDDISFAQDGTPALPAGEITREGRYSWAYMCRRPQTQVTTAVDVSIVVYNKRSLAFANTLQPDESAFAATFDTSRNVVTLTWPGASLPPSLRPGGWILDATPVPQTANATLKSPFQSCHAHFYRVVAITELNTTSWEVEVQRPFREFAGTNNQPQAGSTNLYTGTVVVMEGVAEVFDKDNGWVP